MDYLKIKWLLSLVLMIICNGCTSYKTSFDSKEITGYSFKIRVTAYEESGSFPNGAYYVFESLQTDSNTWDKIMVFRHDDQIDIPTDQIRFINDKTAYLFMGWSYAITTNKGKSWCLWNAKQDLLNWKCCNYELIKDVVLNENGHGVMKLNVIPGRTGEVAELHTVDFGCNWK